MYLKILNCLNTLPFGVGNKLLVDILQGNNSKQVEKHKFNKNIHFSILSNELKQHIVDNINLCKSQQFVEDKKINTFIKVLEITKKGKEEIKNPQGIKTKDFAFKSFKPTTDDLKLISSFNFFLEKYSQKQAQAIVSTKNKLLCIAGAGSGKTTVLTKRIEFLTKYKSVDPKKILAITFTRKAKEEMIHRLNNPEVNIETFNSFCEKITKKHNHLMYENNKSIISFGQKIKIVSQAIRKCNTSFKKISSTYFSQGQRRLKTDDRLLFQFVGDVFSIITFFKRKQQKITQLHENISGNMDKHNAKILYKVCNKTIQLMEEQNLRDYVDQVVDTMKLFKLNQETIPKYEHILIDEFQDVNSMQINLLEILNPTNLFAVGDPRQSIFGWRGSDIKFIYDFANENPNNIIILEENYRSTPMIVDIANKVISNMNIQKQVAFIKENTNSNIIIKNYDSENYEHKSIANKVSQIYQFNQEIFILARTNKQLEKISGYLRQKNIPYILKTEDGKQTAREGHVTLATIHSIKGLEASYVFLMGASTLYFPCKVSDHPVIDSLNKDYNKFEEERRLLYVALTRAKRYLHISYASKKPTFFIPDKPINEFKEKEPKIYSKKEKTQEQIHSILKDWRLTQARILQIPAYMILNDKTINELSTKKPTSINHLNDIYGLGERKIERFGKEILEMIN